MHIYLSQSTCFPLPITLLQSLWEAQNWKINTALQNLANTSSVNSKVCCISYYWTRHVFQLPVGGPESRIWSLLCRVVQLEVTCRQLTQVDVCSHLQANVDPFLTFIIHFLPPGWIVGDPDLEYFFDYRSVRVGWGLGVSLLRAHRGVVVWAHMGCW